MIGDGPALRRHPGAELSLALGLLSPANRTECHALHAIYWAFKNGCVVVAMPTRNPLLCDQRQANLYVSRVIPWVLGGIIAYACYIFTKTLCSKHIAELRGTNGRL